MKKSLLAAAILAAFMAPQVVGAEGFGIVEWSTEGVAMGGARMFADNDPANMAYNPASITKVNGKALKMGVTYISPHGKHTINGMPDMGKPELSQNQVNPGFVPGMYYVQKMDDKNWWGMGCFTRYGLISGRKPGTVAGFDNLRAKMIGLSVTPTYAHKFDKKWTAAVGADINYVGLEMRKDLSIMGTPAKQLDIDGKTTALGWNAGVTYAFDDKNEMGVTYRSKIKHSMNAHAYLDTATPLGKINGDAYGIVTLPDQWNIGYSHKFDQKNRVELSAMRTNWHTYDSFDMKFSGLMSPFDGWVPNYKGYSDTWRYGIGYEHAFSKKYTGMMGFAWDDHGIPYEGGDFICPTGVRRTVSAGVRYNDDKQAVAFAIGWQFIGSNTFAVHSTPYEAKGYDNFAKIFSVSYEYHF